MFVACHAEVQTYKEGREVVGRRLQTFAAVWNHLETVLQDLALLFDVIVVSILVFDKLLDACLLVLGLLDVGRLLFRQPDNIDEI